MTRPESGLAKPADADGRKPSYTKPDLHRGPSLGAITAKTVGSIT
jgi:hypothetical protein